MSEPVVGRPNRYALFGAMLAFIPVADVSALVDGGVTGSVSPAAHILRAYDAAPRSLAGIGHVGIDSLRPKNIVLMQEALAALDAGEASRTLAIRNGFPAKSVEHRILSWVLARNSALSSAEIAEVVRTLPDWPGMDALGRNVERAFFRERPEPQAVLAFFGDGKPVTYEGMLMLVRAHVALAETDKAKALLAPYWRTAKLEAKAENATLKEFGELLTTADHRVRMEQMLYLERVGSAERVAKEAGAPELAKAWGAMIRSSRETEKLLEAVPEAQRSAGWFFAKAKHLRRKEEFVEAAEVMLKAPRDAAALVDPDAW